jgi:hypothetical protein
MVENNVPVIAKQNVQITKYGKMERVKYLQKAVNLLRFGMG